MKNVDYAITEVIDVDGKIEIELFGWYKDTSHPSEDVVDFSLKGLNHTKLLHISGDCLFVQLMYLRKKRKLDMFWFGRGRVDVEIEYRMTRAR